MKKEIINSLAVDLTGHNGVRGHVGYLASEKLAVALKELIERTDLDKLPRSFRPANLRLLALKKLMRLETIETGSIDHKNNYCDLMTSYWLGRQNLGVHVLDIEKDGSVKILWEIVVINGTNQAYLHPSTKHGHNSGFLEKIGLVKDIPILPALPDKIMLGRDVPSLISHDERKTVFFLSEINERSSLLQKQANDLKKEKILV
jgi:hypothetical protein